MMKKVEFELPPPDEDGEHSTEIELEGNPLSQEVETKSKEAVEIEEEAEAKEKAEAKEDKVEIEIVDDVPEVDRDRKVSKPPEAVTEEELKNYSKDAAKRLKKFSKGYHDERRAKEQAMRESTELERYAKGIGEENVKLRETIKKNQNTMVEQAKHTVATEMENAGRMYKEAYEAGDPEALVKAQTAIARAAVRKDKVDSFKPNALQKEETEVKEVQAPTIEPIRDERADAWADENPWYGTDDEMTSFVVGVHNKLIKTEKLDPRSDEYYERINARMREVFPDQFADEEKEDSKETTSRKKPTNVVAPATRSTAPRKVVLTRTQVALAKRLNVPLELYAEKVAEEERKQQHA